MEFSNNPNNFINIKASYSFKDPLIYLLGNLYDYPYMNYKSVEELNQTKFSELFSTDGDRNVIAIPRYSKFDLYKKFNLTKLRDLKENEKICGIITRGGKLVFKFDNIIYNKYEVKSESDIYYMLTVNLSWKMYDSNYKYEFQSLTNHYDYYETFQRMKNLCRDSMPESDVSAYFSMRHNSLLKYVCTIFGLSYREEDFDPDLLKNYDIYDNVTPDVFDEDKNNIIIGDITVSTNPTVSLINKREKYQNVLKRLSNYKNVIPFYISVSSNMQNFRTVLNDLPLPRVRSRDIQFEVDICQLDELNQVVYRNIKNDDYKEENDLDNIVLEKNYVEETNMKNIDLDYCKEYNEDELLDLMEDEDLKQSYYDKEFKVDDIYKSREKIYHDNESFIKKNKPSHYIPIPPDQLDYQSNSPKIEQDMLVNFFKEINNMSENSINKQIARAFLYPLENSEHCDLNYYVLNNGKYIENQEDIKLDYHKNRYHGESFENYLKRNNILDLPRFDETRYTSNKILHISSDFRDPNIRQWELYSGYNIKKSKDKREYKPIHSVDIDSSYEQCELFKKMLIEKETDIESSIPIDLPIEDNKKCINWRLEYKNQYNNIISKLDNTYAMKYLKYSSLFYEQLMHYSNFSLNTRKYAFFNCGLNNVVCIMRCGYRNMSQSIGKSFCFMGISSDQDFLNCGMWGDLVKERYWGEKFIFRTKWFRLPNYRLEFLRDQYYSIVSTTVSSLSRVDIENVKRKDLIGTFSVRILIGLMASQKAMEKMEDARFAIMSSLSDYTNFQKLIDEKFPPPYRNKIDAWIALRLLKKLPYFRQDIYSENNVKILKPLLDNNLDRIQRSTGGKFNVTAVWSDRNLVNIQDVLDELFLYSHTPKEPSSEYHEEVNAMRTIIEYQSKFDELTDSQKAGKHKDLKDWLLNHNGVGFYSKLLYNASKKYFQDKGINLNKCADYSMSEHIGELTSTKAVIPDKEREIKPKVEENIFRLRGLKHLYPEKKDYFDTEIKRVEEKRQKDKRSYRSKKIEKESMKLFHGRAKVHDIIIQYLEKNIGEKVVDNAVYYMNNNGAVLNDICIKSQYGAKREFYVMNMGAKLMARVVESFFKKMAQSSPTEAISIPGDMKMIKIQEMVDRVTKHAMNNNNKVYYINGDCTKWSASETMESFYVMLEGLTEGWDNNYKQFLKNVIAMWSDKRIQVPKRILDKVYPLTENTKYLQEVKNENYQFRSTHNFLQGVFNYMSSMKADILNNYIIHLWKRMNPDVETYVEYLVHSDDYVICLSVPDDYYIQEFRTLQKKVMRMCGVTDSTKKTNVQRIFMEFVSLVCFNSSINFPLIKKTKEVATTFPCESFKNDSDMVCSRTGECVRVGSDFFSAYIFHKIHMHLLRRAYSLHENGRNYMPQKLSFPAEAFGESDMHPIFYLLCKGDPNNIRLHYFSTNSRLLKIMHYYEMKKNDSLEVLGKPLYYPKFIYNNYTERITDLRQSTGYTSSYANDYWKNNIVLNFIKPKTVEDLLSWCKCMYFKSSFVKAYNRDSRTTRQLRLSLFSSKSCMTFKTEEELDNIYTQMKDMETHYEKEKFLRDNFQTINEIISYYHDLLEIDDRQYKDITEIVSDKDILSSLQMGDSTVDVIYKWIDNVQLHSTDKQNIRNTAASRSPYSLAWLNISEPLDKLLCYMFDREKLYSYFTDINEMSLEHDTNEIIQKLPGYYEKVNNKENQFADRLNSLQKIINSYQNNFESPNKVCITYSHKKLPMSDFLANQFRVLHNSINFTYVDYERINTIRNPYSREEEQIIGSTGGHNYLKRLVNDAVLHIQYLYIYKKMNMEEIEYTLKNSNIPIAGDYKNLAELLSETDLNDITGSSTEYSDKLMYVFLRKFLLDDDIELNRLVQNKNHYSYRYTKPQSKDRYGRYYGLMKAEYQCSDVTGMIYYDNNIMKVKSDYGNISKIHMVYLLALKLTGQITESKFYALINRNKPKKDMVQFKTYERGHFFCLEKNKIILKRVEKDKSIYGFPVVMDNKYRTLGRFENYQSLFEYNNFYIKGLSINYGNRKIFNLPVSRANYYYCGLKLYNYNDYVLENNLLEMICKDKPSTIRLNVTEQMKRVETYNPNDYDILCPKDELLSMNIDSLAYQQIFAEPGPSSNRTQQSTKNDPYQEFEYQMANMTQSLEDIELFDVEGDPELELFMIPEDEDEEYEVPSQSPYDRFDNKGINIEKYQMVMEENYGKDRLKLDFELLLRSLGLYKINQIISSREFFYVVWTAKQLYNKYPNSMTLIINYLLRVAHFKSDISAINGYAVKFDGDMFIYYERKIYDSSIYVQKPDYIKRLFNSNKVIKNVSFEDFISSSKQHVFYIRIDKKNNRNNAIERIYSVIRDTIYPKVPVFSINDSDPQTSFRHEISNIWSVFDETDEI